MGGREPEAQGGVIEPLANRVWQLGGKLNRPRDIGRFAPELAIYKVRNANQEEADRCNHDETVADAGPGETVAKRIVESEEHQAKNASVARHPSLPDFQGGE